MVIGALPPIGSLPQPTARGGFGRAETPGSGYGETQPKDLRRNAPVEQTDGTPRPVPAPHGVLALSMDQIAALQGVPGAPQDDTKSDIAQSETDKSGQPGALTTEEEAAVRDLANTDREVRRHEQAHAAAGGAHAGAPSYQYQQGPDGKRYAVGGEVSIDTSPVQGDPEATIAKMQQVKAAANAPAQPSGQDRSVSAAASAIAAQAEAELRAQSAAESAEKSEDKSGKEGEASIFDAPSASPLAAANASGDSPRSIRPNSPPGSLADISV